MEPHKTYKRNEHTRNGLNRPKHRLYGPVLFYMQNFKIAIKLSQKLSVKNNINKGI